MPCSLCHAEGHNARTCPIAPPWRPDAPTARPAPRVLAVVHRATIPAADLVPGATVRLQAVVYQVSETFWRAECPLVEHSMVHGRDKEEAVQKLLELVSSRDVRPEVRKAEFFEVVL